MNNAAALRNAWKRSGTSFPRFIARLDAKKTPYLSHSRVACVQRCPRCYYQQYILGEYDESPAMQIGSVFHRVASRFYLTLRQGRLSKPQELVKAAALAKVPKESHPLVRNALTLLRSNYWDGHEVVTLEEPFFMELASGLPPVIGIPDLVLRRDGSFLVVDHKTSKAFKDLDSSQLVLYAEHIRRQYSTNSIIGVFDEYRLVADLSSIRKPAFRRTPVSVDRSFLPALIAKYRKAWRKIRSIQNHGEPSASSDCWICNQNSYSSYY